MKAFHGSAEIKAKYVARLAAHHAADDIIQGTGWENGHGCAVGCTLHQYDHAAYETELGLPLWLARLEDRIFEGLPAEQAKHFTIDFLTAIPAGADVSEVRFQLAVKRHTKDRARLSANNADYAKQCVAALDTVIAYCADPQRTAASARVAESAAWSAARSASAAWSAARSASAAWSAAWSAESAEWSARSAARSAWSAESAEWSARSAARSAESAESAESAAWSAARSARSASAARSAQSAESAESAAWSAEWSEWSASAESAAWSARSAARSAESAESAESAAQGHFVWEAATLLELLRASPITE